MVLCIIALLVFSVMSLGSAKYKTYAKQALGCVLKNLTLSPCDVAIEQKIKGKVTAKLLRFPTLARFFYRNFTVISWVFTVSFFVSLAYSIYAIYNTIVYGTCEPGSICYLTTIGLFIGRLQKTLGYAVLILMAAVALYLIISWARRKHTSRS
jgi:hypothetical protein